MLMMTMSDLKWSKFENAQTVAQSACDQILILAASAIEQRGIFRIVLAGGSTPQLTYELLSQQDSDWANWVVYFGDERCLPADHADRNSVMAQHSLFNKVAIKPDQIHVMPTEMGAVKAAVFYQDCIKRATPFDLVLLGMGEDGHTASIFPGQAWQDKESVYDVHDAPKLPSDRVTLSARTLGNTRKLLYLITGASKAEAISKWLTGETLPVNSILAQFECEILIDEEAYPQGF